MPETDARRAQRSIVIVFGILCVYFTGVFSPWANPNELSRFQTVVAMAEWKTFSIDQAVAQLGDHEDKAESGGRLYSNKAPGLAFAAYPAYRALRTVSSEADVPRNVRRALVLMRLLTVSSSADRASRFGARLAEARHRGAAVVLVTLAVALGTPHLFYARSFFSHAWTAALLFLAWDAPARRGRAPAGRGPRRGAGRSAGGLGGDLGVHGRPGGARARSARPRRPVLPAICRVCARGGRAARPAALLRRRLLRFAVDPLVRERGGPGVCRARAPRRLRVRPAEPADRPGVSPRPGARRAALLALSAVVTRRTRALVEERPAARRLVVRGGRWGLSSSRSAATELARGWSLGSRYLLPGVSSRRCRSRGPSDAARAGSSFAATVFAVAGHALLTASFVHLPLEMPWPAATGALWFLGRGWVAPNLGTLIGAGPRCRCSCRPR